MSVAPYGVWAEQAARALSRLIHSEEILAEPEYRGTVMAAREAIIDALRDRLRNHFDVKVRNDDPAASNPVRFDVLQVDPMRELGYVIERRPRLPDTAKVAPSETLAPVPDPVARLWVRAATAMLNANHALDSSGSSPWRPDPSAHAALAADTAQVTEALSVLDERLNQVGALAGHTAAGGIQSGSTTEARLVISTIDRFAAWTADHAAVDRAASGPVRPVEHDQSIQLVRSSADLSAAQARLESFLAPLAEHDLPRPHRLSATSAVEIEVNQDPLLARLRARFLASPELARELPRLEQLRERFDQVIYALRGLHDTYGPRPQPLLRNQQREISVAVARGLVQDLGDREAVDLLTSTESMLSTWASAVRREGLRRTTALRVARRGPIEEPVYGHFTKTGPAVKALSALAAHRPTQRDPESTLPTPERDQLRQRLAQLAPSDAVESWPGLRGRHFQERTPPARSPGAGYGAPR